MKPEHPYQILDVFSASPLEGNPLAVFTEGEAVPSRLMQATARELSLSETIFLLPGDDEVDATVRIFTPTAELPFAGHPVLGAAFVVGAERELTIVRLRTAAGVVPVRLTRAHGQIVSGEMEQPIPRVVPYGHAGAVLAALAVERSALPVELYSNGPEYALVALESPAQVAALAPERSALTALGNIGVGCFARSDFEQPQAGGRPASGLTPLRVHFRMFAPAMGVSEDPATGSAAGPLALHLVRHGWARPGQPVEITQGVELLRHSKLLARVEGPADSPTGILVSGAAVVVAHGHYRLQ